MRPFPNVERRDDVFLLNLGGDENRWTPHWIRTVLGLLDEVAAAPEPRGLVTVATGRHWSSGLDLEWLTAHPEETSTMAHLFHVVLGRMLTLPVLTVAAIGGHAFGAGAMLALAHDFRTMRADQGLWCLPESDLGFAFTDGTAALIQAKLNPAAAHRAMLTAHRFSGAEAAEAGIVDAAVPADQVVDAAIAIAAPLAVKPAGTVGAIKQRIYAGIYAALMADSDGY